MVTSLMQTTKESADGHDRMEEFSVSSPSQTTQTSLREHLEVGGSETTYLGATHWVTVLENVRFLGRTEAIDTLLT